MKRFLCLTLCSLLFAGNLPAAENTVYIWNRNWTPEIKESITDLRNCVSHYAVLCGELKYRGNHWEAFQVRIDGSYFEEGSKITLAVRIPESASRPFSVGNFEDFLGLLAKVMDSAAEALARNGIVADGLQLDYDCPTSKLNDYAQLLDAIVGRFPGLKVSVTALPTWLGASSFKGLASKTAFYVLQLHAFEIPKDPARDGKIFLSEEATAYVKTAADLNHPFYISLPTYGYEILYNQEGRFIGLRAEGALRNSSKKVKHRVVETKTEEILSFLARLDESEVQGLQGIYWFRMPVESDEFNWSVDSFKSVIERHMPTLSFSVTHEFREKNLVEVYLVNSGERNTKDQVCFSINWKEGEPFAHDILGKYREDGTLGARTQIVGPAPKVGQKAMIGWFRFDNVRNRPPLFETSGVGFYEKS